jgi:hypothetical protein
MTSDRITSILKSRSTATGKWYVVKCRSLDKRPSRWPSWTTHSATPNASARSTWRWSMTTMRPSNGSYSGLILIGQPCELAVVTDCLPAYKRLRCLHRKWHGHAIVKSDKNRCLQSVIQKHGASQNTRVPKTPPLMQLFMPTYEIRADGCRHVFSVTSKLPAYLAAIL